MARGPVAAVNPVLVDELPADEKQGGAKSPYVDHLSTLREQPGSWFDMAHYAKRQSAQIRKGDLEKRWAQDGFEFTVRTVNGEHILYARHAGAQPNGKTK